MQALYQLGDPNADCKDMHVQARLRGDDIHRMFGRNGKTLHVRVESGNDFFSQISLI